MLASIDPALRAISWNQLLGKVDTRLMARAWIRENIPPGSPILSLTHFYYGKPELPNGCHYVQGNVTNGDPSADWVVVDEHPIQLFSPSPDEATRRYLRIYAGRLRFPMRG